MSVTGRSTLGRGKFVGAAYFSYYKLYIHNWNSRSWAFRYCKVGVAGYIHNNTHFINLYSVCIHTYLDSIGIKSSSIPFKCERNPGKLHYSNHPARGKIRNKEREEKREDQNLTESKESNPKCVTSYLLVIHSSTFVHFFNFHISLSRIKACPVHGTSLVCRTHVHN